MTVLAADSAEHLGRVVGALLIPILGIVLLIIGLKKRSDAKRPPSPPQYGTGYPQQAPGYPPQGPVYPQYGPQAYPPNQPAPFAAPPPQRKSAGKGLIIAGAVLLGLGLLAGVARVAQNASSGGKDLAVGDCITNESYVAADLDPKTVSCSDSSAVFELATETTADRNCPDGQREASGYAVLINSKTTLCFVLNLVEGDCYNVEPSKRSFEPAACTSDVGVIRVDRRIDGSTDETACDAGQTSVSFPEPARVYCFAAA